MSEYLVVRADQVRVLPSGLPLRRAALAEPLAVALHGIAVAGGVEGKRVLVSGSGPIGLLAAAGALAKGATTVTSTDVFPVPLGRARKLGVHQTIQVGVEEVPPGSFDVVLECSGVPAAINAAFTAVTRGGIVAQIGMLPNEPKGINLAPMISKEVQLRGSLRFNDEIGEAVELLAANSLFDEVISHEIGAEDVLEALEIATDAAVSGKVVVALWPEST